MTLGWILAASFVGGTLSAGLAAFSLLLRASWVPILVSFASSASVLLTAAVRSSASSMNSRIRSSSVFTSCCANSISFCIAWYSTFVFTAIS